MPTRHHTLLLSCLLLTLTFHAQQRTDHAEYGYKGPVKKVIIKGYKTAAIDTVTGMVRDTNQWDGESVYYFNQQGYLDSIVYLTRSGDTSYGSSRIYTGTGNNRVVLRKDDEGKVVGTARYNWVNDTAYQSTELADEGRKLFREVQLTSFSRRKTARNRIYKNDLLIEEYSFVCYYDEQEFLIQVDETSSKTNYVSTRYYGYAGINSHGNPHTIYHYEADGKTIQRMLLFEIEYY